jgi:CTP synthase
LSKYIIVAGGVISGTGKGVSAASIGLLLKQRGHTVELIKFDPYLNINAGILAPREHGECFLCDDGTETDLDLGHYERIAGVTVGAENICTAGTIYKELVEEQEDGKWLGHTIQVMPHVTDKISERLLNLGKKADIVIAEIGGTVGDVESDPFFKAVARFKQKYENDCMVVMVSPILWVPTIKEFKTKPLQRSLIDLKSHGLNPDMLLCRVDRDVPSDIIRKVSDTTGVPIQAVFDAPDVKTIYQVPIEFYNREVDDMIVDKLRLKRKGCRIGQYRKLVEKANNPTNRNITIGIFGKYENCDEAYISLKEALMHAGLAQDVNVNIEWINSSDLEACKNVKKYFKDLDGIIVPGGFDKRGVEGKIKAIKYARENNVPFLGICLGLQCAVIEYARNVMGLKGASSLEFDKKCEHPVINYVEGQEDLKKKSGTMRLGAYDCVVTENSVAHSLYGKQTISERHRHRYEVNNDYINDLEKHGMLVSGVNPKSGLVEIVEITDHKYFIATQAHPEFKSSIVNPAPLFKGLIDNCLAFRV